MADRRRKAAGAVVALCVVLALAGCASQPAGQSGSDSPAESLGNVEGSMPVEGTSGQEAAQAGQTAGSQAEQAAEQSGQTAGSQDGQAAEQAEDQQPGQTDQAAGAQTGQTDQASGAQPGQTDQAADAQGAQAGQTDQASDAQTESPSQTEKPQASEHRQTAEPIPNDLSERMPYKEMPEAWIDSTYMGPHDAQEMRENGTMLYKWYSRNGKHDLIYCVYCNHGKVHNVAQIMSATDYWPGIAAKFPDFYAEGIEEPPIIDEKPDPLDYDDEDDYISASEDWYRKHGSSDPDADATEDWDADGAW